MLALYSYFGLFAPLCIAIVGISFVSALSRLFPQIETSVVYKRKIS